MRIVPSLLVGLLLGSTAGAATLYKWVDKNGVTHYSDRPVAGATKVEVQETQTYTPAQSPASAARPTSSSQQAVANYREIQILRPQPDETFANTGNTVPVRLRVDPELQPGHSIWLYVDGKRLDGLSTTSNSFELPEVYRGTHTLNAVVTDGTGKQLVTSNPVTFHVRQTNLLSPGSRTRTPAPPSAGR